MMIIRQTILKISVCWIIKYFKFSLICVKGYIIKLNVYFGVLCGKTMKVKLFEAETMSILEQLINDFFEQEVADDSGITMRFDVKSINGEATHLCYITLPWN